ncbi:class I SAM-dependent methyltransferase [Virgibacillus siamensis]|uniref:class I SAM-dependent methyltransferase n=1 Tax=Virgibacillus siamensis TaxID=480071 RepID=UPI000986C248|nr:class I SAM-dependent methyltransferase [Virgibacillus siamensis]
MKQGESSITSLVSAFGRAYHSQFGEPKIFDDYIVRALISEREFQDIRENMISGVEFFNRDIAEKYKDDPEEMLKWITQVQLSSTTLARAAYCEKVLSNALDEGTEQYVILGAGLDTFCYRHPDLEASLEVFEIDHPATQQFKRNRLAEKNFMIPDNLHFISMDFTKGFSLQKLIDKGFDPARKTFFSLLGVSYYLKKKELALLIQSLFSEMQMGSSIVFDYADEGLFYEKGFSDRVQNMVKMAEAGGEPMQSSYSFAKIRELLEGTGLQISEHLSPQAIQASYFQNRQDHLSAFETIHYIHAVLVE